MVSRQAQDVGLLFAGGHIDRQARVMLVSFNTNLLASQGGLERIRNQPMPVHYDMFIRTMAWVFALVAFNLHFLEQPMCNSVSDLPMYRFCGTITGDLLGRDHPLARPREGDNALVWW